MGLSEMASQPGMLKLILFLAAASSSSFSCCMKRIFMAFLIQYKCHTMSSLLSSTIEVFTSDIFFSLAPGSLLLWDGRQGPQVGFLGRRLYPYKQMCRESKCDLITCGVVNMSPKIHRVKSNHTGGAIRRWHFGDG